MEDSRAREVIEERRREMKKYKLVIKPAIETTDRHQIERLLEEMEYEVEGGGQMIDGSSCDITFEKVEKL